MSPVARKIVVLGGMGVAGYASYKIFCPAAGTKQQLQTSPISSLSTGSNINRTDNPNVFFDVEINGEDVGRITMEVTFK